MKEDEFDAVDLSPLDPAVDPAGWQRVVDGTLARVDGDAEASASSSSAATQSLYSSAVRLLAVGLVALSLSACASVGVKPMPIRTAVGIAARAIALPAGMWNLVNSGFLGAA